MPPQTLTKIMPVEDDPDIRAIAVMSLEDIGGYAVAAYKALGAVDVIAKPFDPEELCTTVLAIWQRAVKA